MECKAWMSNRNEQVKEDSAWLGFHKQANTTLKCAQSSITGKIRMPFIKDSVANNMTRLIAFWGYIPMQTCLVEFTSVRFLKRRFNLVKNNFSGTSQKRTSLTIISLFSWLFWCYLMQHKRMQINTMDILRLEYLWNFCQITCLCGPQFHYLYNYRGKLGDFEGPYPIMFYNSITTQFDKNFSSSTPSISPILEGELRNMPFFISAFKSKIYVSFIYLDSGPWSLPHLPLLYFAKIHNLSTGKEKVVFIRTPK